MIYHATDDRSLADCFAVVNQGEQSMPSSDTIRLHQGVYTLAIDSYNLRIQGGRSWTDKLLIEPNMTKGIKDKVVLKPTSGDFVVRFAHPAASFIELRDLELDASGVNLSALKVTSAGTDAPAHHIRLVRCQVHGSKNQGILVTGPGCEFLHCEVYGNGRTVNLDHGFYISGQNAIVSGCDVHHNAAYGICFYDGSGKHNATGGQILGNRSYDNGVAGKYGAGILVASSLEALVERNTVWRNDIGIQIYDDAFNTRLLENVYVANRDYARYIAPAAVSSTIVYDDVVVT